MSGGVRGRWVVRFGLVLCNVFETALGRFFNLGCVQFGTLRGRLRCSAKRTMPVVARHNRWDRFALGVCFAPEQEGVFMKPTKGKGWGSRQVC